MNIPISNRLLACADFVPRGARVADVGCDHGYLGVHLLLEGISPFVAAMDLRPEPLKKAVYNAERYGVSEKMQFFECDGLDSLQKNMVDCVVCAGMGGDTIASILNACEWTREEGLRFILQPQTSGNDLRRWLGQNNFSILEEKLVKDGGVLYTVMSVQYGNGQPLSPGEQYVSPQLMQCECEYVLAYISRVLPGLQKAVSGISRAKTEVDAARLNYYQTALHEIEEMRESLENSKRNQ